MSEVRKSPQPSRPISQPHGADGPLKADAPQKGTTPQRASRVHIEDSDKAARKARRIANPDGTTPFVPTRLDDPRNVAAVSVTEPQRVAAGDQNLHLAPRSLMVTLYGADGKPVAEPRPFDLMIPSGLDVVDVVPYALDNGRLKIVVSQALKEATLLADPSGPTLHTALPSGLVRNQEGDKSIKATVKNTLQRKLGFVSHGPLTLLGQVVPSAGQSPELAIQVATPVQLPKQPKASAFGSGRESVLKRDVVDAQDIVDGYLNGSIRDVRLVDATLRLARRLGIKLETKLKLPASTLNKPVEPAIPIESAEHIRDFVANHKGASIAYAKVEPTEASGNFVWVDKHKVTVTKRDGGTLQFESLLGNRKGDHAIDVCAYCYIDGKPHIYLKAGIRPALPARQLEAHPIQTHDDIYNIEGVAGSLPPHADAAIRAEVAMRETREEAGLEPLTVREVGVGFTSPGISTERAFGSFVEVDPSRVVEKTGTQDENARGFLVPAEDVVRLADEGILKDGRATLLAQLLLLEHGTQESPEVPAKVLDQFNELVVGASPLQRLLGKASRQLSDQSDVSHVMRQCVVFAENQLGLTAEDLSHPDESGFFASQVPVFASSAVADSSKMQLNLTHDAGHYIMAALAEARGQAAVPFEKTPEGRWAPVPRDEAVNRMKQEECAAVIFSDIEYPHQIGIPAFEAHIGGQSLAGVFEKLGLNLSEARDAVYAIEGEGRIPEKVLSHSDYAKYRGTLVDRYLKFHVMDNMQANKIYDMWMRNPRVAQVAIEMPMLDSDWVSERISDDDLAQMVVNTTEGHNELKSAMSRTMNVGLRVKAMKLAYLAQILEGQQGSSSSSKYQQRVEKMIDSLVTHFTALRTLRDKVRDIAPSKENLEAFAAYQKAVEQSIKADALIEKIENSKLLTPVQRVRVQGRALPFFEELGGLDMEKVMQETRALERESFARAGVDFEALEQHTPLAPKEFKARFEEIVSDLKLKQGWHFKIGLDDTRPFLQVQSPDFVGARKYFLSPHMKKNEVVFTAFMAVRQAQEHELRKSFLFRGHPIMRSHHNVDVMHQSTGSAPETSRSSLASVADIQCNGFKFSVNHINGKTIVMANHQDNERGVVLGAKDDPVDAAFQLALWLQTDKLRETFLYKDRPILAARSADELLKMTGEFPPEVRKNHVK